MVRPLVSYLLLTGTCSWSFFDSDAFHVDLVTLGQMNILVDRARIKVMAECDTVFPFCPALILNTEWYFYHV